MVSKRFSSTGCRRLKNTSEKSLPEVFFNWFLIVFVIFGEIFGFVLENVGFFLDLFGKFWDYSGSVLGHFWNIFGNFWNFFGKCLGSFGNIFGTILEEKLKKSIFFFFELKNISVPEIFFN